MKDKPRIVRVKRALFHDNIPICKTMPARGYDENAGAWANFRFAMVQGGALIAWRVRGGKLVEGPELIRSYVSATPDFDLDSGWKPPHEVTALAGLL